MQCYCDTDTSSTMGIHGAPGNERRDQMPGMSQCLLVVYPNRPGMAATQSTPYRNYRSAKIIESLHDSIVILNFSRACVGHCLVVS